MATLIIKDDDYQSQKFLEYALTLPFVALAKSEPPCQYSSEELKFRALSGIRNYKTGNFTSHEDMKKRYATAV